MVSRARLLLRVPAYDAALAGSLRRHAVHRRSGHLFRDAEANPGEMAVRRGDRRDAGLWARCRCHLRDWTGRGTAVVRGRSHGTRLRSHPGRAGTDRREIGTGLVCCCTPACPSSAARRSQRAVPSESPPLTYFVALARGRTWHELTVRCTAAIPSGYSVTFTVPTSSPARLLATLNRRRPRGTPGTREIGVCKSTERCLDKAPDPL